MKELEKIADLGLKKFIADGGDLNETFSELDNRLQNTLDAHNVSDKTIPNQHTKVKIIRNWIFILLAIIFLGAIFYATWKKPKDEFQAQTYYAQYFEVLSHPGIAPDRNNIDASLSNISDGFKAYSNNNFRKAADLLSQKDANAEALIFAGISYLQINNTEMAISVLEKASNKVGYEAYDDIGQWYLALAYLKSSNLPSARKLLVEIASGEHFKNDQAKDILEAMEEQ